MTTGEFHSVVISSVTINRADRHRGEIKNEHIEELADSIRRVGLINPICLTRQGVLVAGECRLTACKRLGWTHIPAQYVDELSQETLECIELEENIKRADISWPDKCKAVQRIHNLRKQIEPKWVEADTARFIGVEPATVNRYLNLADEMEKGNEVIKAIASDKSSKISQAITTMYKQRDRKAAAEMDLLNAAVFADAKADDVPTDGIIHGDFNEWAPTYDGPKFNLIHCDFPYGIDADKFNQGQGPVHGTYADTAENYWRLCRTLAACGDRLCSDSAHLIFWFSPRFYCDTRSFFEAHTDWVLDPFPLVWHKTDGAGIIPDPLRGPRRTYEMAFFGVRGDRKVVKSVANSYGSPHIKDDHMSVKPEPMLRHFFEMVVDETTVMLDPTCGSGSSIRAAEAVGAKCALGLEVNSEFAERARVQLLKARRLRRAAS